MDHDEKLMHEETPRAESVSMHDKNESCDNKHVPESLSANSGVLYIIVWMMTVGLYLFNGATVASIGPIIQIGEDTLNKIKHQGEFFGDQL
jgi:hypothetical protein